MRGVLQMFGDRPKIGVFSVVGSAFSFAWENFFTLLRLGWLPVLISSSFSYVSGLPELLDPPEWVGQINPLIFQISFFLAYLVWAVFAVAVHRLVLVEDEPPRGLFYFRMTTDEFRYALAPLAISILPFGILALGNSAILGPDGIIWAFGSEKPIVEQTELQSNIQNALSIGSVIVAVYVGMRLLLTLPIVAVEHKIGLWKSWSVSGGNVLRLILAYFVLFIALAIFFIFVGFAFALFGFAGFGSGLFSLGEGTGQSALSGFIITTLGAAFLLNYLSTVAGIAVLSFSYDELTSRSISSGDRIKDLRSSADKA